MYWMFAGYLTSFWAALAVHAVLTIESHPKPLLGLAASLILIPALIAAFSCESVLLSPNRWKNGIRRAFVHGSLGRTTAFGAGLVTGIAVLICFAIGYQLNGLAESGRVVFLKRHEDAIFWGSGLMLLFVTALAPIIPGWWLAAKAVSDEKGKLIDTSSEE